MRVVVDVSHADAHAVGRFSHSREPRHVGERARAGVPVQPVSRAGPGVAGQRPAVDGEYVQPAVVVVVQKRDPGPHRLHEILLARPPVDVPEVDA